MPITKWDKLKIAIHKKEINEVKSLLPEVDIKKKGETGITLLHIAVFQKAPKEILNLLITEFKKKNVSLDIVDDSKQTPLDYAFLSGNILAIELLIKAGADYKRKAFDGLDKTFLDCFLKKNPNEREKINTFIQQCEQNVQTTEKKQMFQDELRSTTLQEPKKTIEAFEKTKTNSSHGGSVFDFVGNLVNQFKGYVKVQSSDESTTMPNNTRKPPKPRPFEEHIKDE